MGGDAYLVYVMTYSVYLHEIDAECDCPMHRGYIEVPGLEPVNLSEGIVQNSLDRQLPIELIKIVHSYDDYSFRLYEKEVAHYRLSLWNRLDETEEEYDAQLDREYPPLTQIWFENNKLCPIVREREFRGIFGDILDWPDFPEHLQSVTVSRRVEPIF